MNLALTFTQNKTFIQVDGLAPLSWLASGLESCALWFFGRQCFHLGFTRMRTPNDDDIVVWGIPLTATGVVGPLRWSNHTTISAIVPHFPARLVHPNETKDNETVINFTNFPAPNTTIGALAYGLADATCDLFKRGATTVTCQYSLTLSQVWGNVGLTDRQLKELADPRVPDYQLGDHVGMLS